MTNSNSDSKNFFSSIAEYFVTRWRVSLILLLAITVAGGFGILNNQRQDFPTIPVNAIFINASYFGASSLDIENQVAIPIEQASSGVDEVDSINTQVFDNFATFQLELEVFDQEEIDQVASQLDAEINKLSLPAEVETEVSTFSAAGPSIILAVVGEDKTQLELLEKAGELADSIQKSSSEIQEAVVAPKPEFQVSIALDSDKVTANRLSFAQINQAINSYLATTPGGQVVGQDGFQKQIQIRSTTTSLQDLGEIPLGSDLQLSDVASISRELKTSEQAISAGYLDNQAKPVWKSAVYLEVYKQDDGDVIRISEAVQDQVQELKDSDSLGSGFALEIISNSSDSVDLQINQLIQSGVLGFVLVVVVLLLFINLRASLVIASILPLVFLITFFILYQLGFTINTLTLFAMILALGVLVDNAIVVVEGIVFEIEKGKTKPRAVLDAISKFAPAITSATATTLVVFIPFAFLPGIIGQFMRFIPITIIIMLVTSYLLAITITPLLASWILDFKHQTKPEEVRLQWWQKVLILPVLIVVGQRLVDKLADWYAALMFRVHNSIGFLVALLLAGLVVIGGGLYSFTSLEGGQFPDVDGPFLSVNYQFQTGTPDSVQTDILAEIQDEILTVEHFQSFYYAGDSILVRTTEPVERDNNTTIFDITEDLNQKLQAIDDKYSELEVEARKLSNGPPESEFDLILEIRAEDLENQKAIAEALNSEFAEDSEVLDIFDGYQDNLVSSVEVQFDQTALTQNQTDPLLAGRTIQSVFSQVPAGLVSLEGKAGRESVVLGFDAETSGSIESLESLLIPTQSGSLVALQEVAKVQEVEKLQSLKRLDGERVLEFGFKTQENTDIQEFQKQVLQVLGLDQDSDSQIILTDSQKASRFGIQEADRVSFAGAFADTADSFSDLLVVVVLALIAVYIILVNQFGSYLKPALIMFVIIAAFSGALPGLMMFDEGLNLISGLGLVALVGIAVNDAIVFLDTRKNLGLENPTWSQAKILTEVGRVRLKPILSTTITTVLGVLPLAIEDPFWRGLGVCIIFGLSFSTIATLFLVPIIENLSGKLLLWLKGLRARKN